MIVGHFIAKKMHFAIVLKNYRKEFSLQYIITCILLCGLGSPHAIIFEIGPTTQWPIYSLEKTYFALVLQN